MVDGPQDRGLVDLQADAVADEAALRPRGAAEVILIAQLFAPRLGDLVDLPAGISGPQGFGDPPLHLQGSLMGVLQLLRQTADGEDPRLVGDVAVVDPPVVDEDRLIPSDLPETRPLGLEEGGADAACRRGDEARICGVGPRHQVAHGKLVVEPPEPERPLVAEGSHLRLELCRELDLGHPLFQVVWDGANPGVEDPSRGPDQPDLELRLDGPDLSDRIGYVDEIGVFEGLLHPSVVVEGEDVQLQADPRPLGDGEV
ncbi:MAG: hypothetical protein A4E51_00864 [Methanosaeta sp. PtaU1.Bin055]|nr:MAG: hypothetical protein A4E51_00864 [Methanosaeta sp. PtaU1.Bin055]